jgi:hypothetical protein
MLDLDVQEGNTDGDPGELHVSSIDCVPEGEVPISHTTLQGPR